MVEHRGARKHWAAGDRRERRPRTADGEPKQSRAALHPAWEARGGHVLGEPIQPRIAGNEQVAPTNELTKNCCNSYIRPKILKTEIYGDISGLAICFYHLYTMQMKNIAIWLLPLFDSELFD